MLIRIQPGSAEPLFTQIAVQLRRGIYEGTLSPGDRLPTARELASTLDVNMHTVRRAYQALRDEGLVEVRRGRGVRVVGQPKASAKLLEMTEQLVDEATQVGLASQELLELVAERLRLRGHGGKA